MRKKLIAVMLTVGMLVSGFAVPVSAAENTVKVSDNVSLGLSQPIVETKTVKIGDFVDHDGDGIGGTDYVYMTEEVTCYVINGGTEITFPEGYSFSTEIGYEQFPDEEIDAANWSPEDYQFSWGGLGLSSEDERFGKEMSLCLSGFDTLIGFSIIDTNVVVDAEMNLYKEEGDVYFLVRNPFEDVEEADYYYWPVASALGSGITTGLTPTQFGPDEACTRGQVVTFLWRREGCPQPTVTTCPFTDVAADAYYYDAVLWAVENGITTGVSPTEFAPEDSCTRGQIVTFIWRSVEEPQPLLDTCDFTDVMEGGYYYDAMLWAVEYGVTTGVSESSFAPDKVCTRGEVVTFLWRSEK